jgi:hypothetical protein
MLKRNYDRFGPELERRRAWRAGCGLWSRLELGQRLATAVSRRASSNASASRTHSARSSCTWSSEGRDVVLPRHPRAPVAGRDVAPRAALARGAVHRAHGDVAAQRQEQAIGATARAMAGALSDRPASSTAASGAADPEEEERRRIVALFAAADTDAAASLGSAYAPSEEIERLLRSWGGAARGSG